MAQGAMSREQESQLIKNWLLAANPPGVLALLLRRGELITLKRGTVIYEPEAKLDYCYFPLDCIISLVAVLDDDRSAEVAVFGPESVVAHLGATLGAEAFGRYVVEISGRALKISTRALKEITGECPELGERLRAFSVAFTRQTFQSLACNACHAVEQRCCRWLLTMADKACTNDVPITHDHLAQMLGVQRPTVSIIMRELQSAGLVEQKRGCISILDRRRLLRCSCECYGKAKDIYTAWLPGASSEARQ
ncbi:MAG: Crp/Fnr family transcriptional regulator [Hyphomicrobiales bacterium]|nr:Crp/Fnr family transcriptional regulator [Hyphomicrobiales bacterium]